MSPLKCVSLTCKDVSDSEAQRCLRTHENLKQF